MNAQRGSDENSLAGIAWPAVHSKVEYTTSVLKDAMRLVPRPKAKAPQHEFGRGRFPTAGWAPQHYYFNLSRFWSVNQGIHLEATIQAALNIHKITNSPQYMGVHVSLNSFVIVNPMTAKITKQAIMEYPHIV